MNSPLGAEGIGNSIHLSWFHKLLFELSYGSDFLGIEIFFRGFLILAFVKWVGMDAILPMACFLLYYSFWKTTRRMHQFIFWWIAIGNCSV
jgi:hypothetical protein